MVELLATTVGAGVAASLPKAGRRLSQSSQRLRNVGPTASASNGGDLIARISNSMRIAPQGRRALLDPSAQNQRNVIAAKSLQRLKNRVKATLTVA
jgi:hypothetical protein